MSAAKKKILLNAFNMNCIGHINHGLWTHPRDTSTRYNTLEYWTELAQLLERSGEFLDKAQADTNAETVAAASIAVAEARAISTEISLAAGSTLFELAGSQATLIEHGLDRHWRNARVHTLHDPVRWKYHAVGNYYLNDENPPLRGTL